MEKLLKYLLFEITGEKDFEIKKEETEDGMVLNVRTKPELMGLIIGKSGNTIKAIQTILRIRARKEGTRVSVNISEQA